MPRIRQITSVGLASFGIMLTAVPPVSAFELTRAWASEADLCG